MLETTSTWTYKGGGRVRQKIVVIYASKNCLNDKAINCLFTNCGKQEIIWRSNVSRV